MKVETLMTTDVKTVTRGTPLRETARILAESGISGLPVVDDGKVVGVVSEADILIKERGINPSKPGVLGLLFDHGVSTEAKLRAHTAGEAMTAPAITIGPGRPASEAAARMIDEGVNRLPVVDDAGTLLGIVSRADLVRAFVRSDAEIEHEIREDLILRTLWISPDRITVVVSNGEVKLFGRVDAKHDAELVESLARRVPGVISVESDIAWIDEDERPRRTPEATATR